MATPGQWVAGARPRTLSAAVAPVVVGSAVAAHEGGFSAGRAMLALMVALSLQVAVNYANDYGDGVRGTDTERVGPVRLVGQRFAPAAAVRSAAVIAFAVAGVAGFALVALSGAWWLLLIGPVAMAAAWLYTGGPKPYGYAGLGEVFVFAFFGVVAVAGTAYSQTGRLTTLALLASVPPGLWACAILVANNLRDIPGDRAVGKRTLAVRLGDRRTRSLYVCLVVLGFVAAVILVVYTGWALLVLAAVPAAVGPIRIVSSGAKGEDLIPVLGGTGLLLLIGSLLLGAGIAL